MNLSAVGPALYIFLRWSDRIPPEPSRQVKLPGPPNETAQMHLSFPDGPVPKLIAGDQGNSQKFWFSPSKWIDGLTQKTCRDNGHHAQY